MQIELNITFNHKLSSKDADYFKQILADIIENGIQDNEYWFKNIGYVGMSNKYELFYEYCGQ